MKQKYEIENIQLNDTYFTVYSSGTQPQSFDYDAVAKVYIRVKKNSNGFIFLHFALQIVLLLFSLKFLHLYIGMFLFLPALLAISLKIVHSKYYIFVIKRIDHTTQEFIVLPKLKLRLIDKMRNVRAAIDQQKFQRTPTNLAV